MSHNIQPADLVLSDRCPEWHGLARVAPIDDQSIRPLLFRIEESPVSCFATSGDGGTMPLTIPGYKALSAVRPGLPTLPLSVQAESYKVIENSAVWEALKTALKDHPHTVTTAGTLGSLTRFFISVQLHEAGHFKAGTDEFRAYLNFITSHDGTLSLKAYDSSVRIVCQNTLNMSLASAGKFGLAIRHTSGASAEIRGMSEWIEATLKARREFGGFLEELDSLPVTPGDARAAAAAWIWEVSGRPAEMGGRLRNHVDGITGLFSRGAGNHGRSAYDLWNGVTEYYTRGRGAGVTVAPEQRVINAQFGGAADRKADFTRRLLAGELPDLIDAGRTRTLALLS